MGITSMKLDTKVMDYQNFRETMPYCVYYYYETKSVVVKNKDGQCIYDGLMVTNADCRSVFRAFSCPFPDCFRDTGDYLQSYLYDEKKPIFKKGNTFNEKRMNKYLERHDLLWRFLLNNVKETKPSFMH